MKYKKEDLAILSTLEYFAVNDTLASGLQHKHQRHKIRYLTNKLLKSEVITQKRPAISSEALGYFFSNIFFSIHSERRKRKDDLIHYIAKAPAVSWFFELGGDFQYGLSLKVKSLLK